MIEKIFYNVFVLGTIISISVLPILIFLAKNKYKYNFKSIYKIFLIILLLLLLPINSFNFSKIKENLTLSKQENILENIDSEVELENKLFEIQKENLIIEFDNSINNTISVKNNIFFKVFNIVPYIWIDITMLLIVYNIFNYLIFLYKLKSNYNVKNNIMIDNAIYEISKSIGLKPKIAYEISDKITTPMTIGILRKKIILPTQILENNEYEVILKHELFHIKNKDIEYKFLLLLLDCIYWFNPIIYNFTNQVDEILELNCDENVLENKEDAYRIEYAKVLLDQIEQNRNKQYNFSMNFANRRKNIMNRFSNIVNKQEKKNTISLAGILTVLVIIALVAIICIPNINFATIEENIMLKGENDVQNELSENKIDENEEKVDDVANLVKANEVEEKEENNNTTKIVTSITVDETIPENNEKTTEDNSSFNTVVNTSKKMDEIAKVDARVEFDLPLKEDYTLTFKFGKINNGSHTGMDLATESGNNIYAAASGIVQFSGWKGSYGYLVVIAHNDELQTYYAHCSELYVQVGQTVEKGEVIAAVGSTGNSIEPHLHFELRNNGTAVNPANYLTF